MKRQFIYSVLLLLTFCTIASAQQEIPLYKNGAGENNGITEKETKDKNGFVINIAEARMYAYLAPKKNISNAAVLICPGGGYWGISAEKEGSEFAVWLNKLGVSAFILYYRMPNKHFEIPLKDAQTALQIIRKGAKEWNIDKHKIGIAGFSAGGHLASTVGTQYTSKNKPDFMVLLYPVISMKEGLTHNGSRKNLLGDNPSEELVNRFSNELHVTKNTAPTFIVVATDDNTVPAENSQLFYKKLQENKVSTRLFTFEKGGHGFGLRKSGLKVDNWPELLKAWFTTNNLTE